MTTEPHEPIGDGPRRVNGQFTPVYGRGDLHGFVLYPRPSSVDPNGTAYDLQEPSGRRWGVLMNGDRRWFIRRPLRGQDPIVFVYNGPVATDWSLDRLAFEFMRATHYPLRSIAETDLLADLREARL